MEWSFWKSILYGLIMGYTEFLPVSSSAHSTLFMDLTGAGKEILMYRFVCHLSGFLVLLFACYPRISRLRREKRIASIPARRRKRQPDGLALLDIRVLKTMSVTAAIFSAGALFLNRYLTSRVFQALLLAVNGYFLYLCRVRDLGNKDSRSFSGLNTFVTGAALGVGCISGMSALGMGMSASCLQGSGRKYASENALMALIPVMVVVMCFDVITIAAAGVVFSLKWVFGYIFAAVSAAIGVYFGITTLRFLSVKSDFSGFAYYCWGAALFMISLYLIV